MSLQQVFNSPEFQKEATRALQRMILEQMSSYNSPMKKDLEKKVSEHLTKFMKKSEYQDILENALNEYINKDVATEIIKKGIEQYVGQRRRY